MVKMRMDIILFVCVISLSQLVHHSIISIAKGYATIERGN